MRGGRSEFFFGHAALSFGKNAPLEMWGASGKTNIVVKEKKWR